MSELVGWLVIPNWDRWQSRKDRHDPWLKDWIDQLDRDEHLTLTLAERGLIADIRRAYARFDGQLRANVLPGLIQARVRINQLERLVEAGFLEISAAKPQPLRGESAARAREEKEVEIETPKPPFYETPKSGELVPFMAPEIRVELERLAGRA